MKRDIQHLKRDGYFVMTRGAKHDMGPGLSHKTQAYWIIDYRIYDVARDGKTKLQHLLDMFSTLPTSSNVGSPFRTVLVDAWYASMKVMKAIEALDKVYYAPLET